MLALGLGLGAVMLVPLALVTANITRTVESAQVTSLPAMAVLMIGAGGILPLDLLPEWAERLITFLPSAPITALVRLGWLSPRRARKDQKPSASNISPEVSMPRAVCPTSSALH